MTHLFIVHRHGADSQNADAPVTFEDGWTVLELPDGSQVRFLTSDMQAVLGGEKAAVVSLVAQPPSDLLDFARLKRIKRRGRR